MTLTNAEKQARWREKHIQRRREADRVATLLVRTKWPSGHVEEIAASLRPFFTTAGIAALRRALKPPKPPNGEEMKTKTAEHFRQWRTLWLKEHPGKTAADFKRLSVAGGEG